MPSRKRGNFTVNDTGPALTGQLHDGTPGRLVPVDLAEASSLAVHILRPRRGRDPIEKAASPVSTAEGRWQAAPWAQGDLDEPGTYKVEVQVTWSDTSVQTFGPDDFEVRREYA